MWQDMIEILGVLSVVYNVSLVFFTGHYLEDLQWQYRWAALVLLEHGALALRAALQAAMRGIPREVYIQLERWVDLTFGIYVVYLYLLRLLGVAGKSSW